MLALTSQVGELAIRGAADARSPGGTERADWFAALGLSDAR
jgi:hypothetical protein